MKFSFKLNERICSDRLFNANKYLNLHLNVKRFFFSGNDLQPIFLRFLDNQSFPSLVDAIPGNHRIFD